MPILNISETQELYKEFESRFVSPYSKINEPMRVEMYQNSISTGLIENIKKKPIIVFYSLKENTEIPIHDWTYEMKQSAKHYINDYPVPDAGKKYSLLGKLVFSITGVGIFAILIGVFYLLYYKIPHQKNEYNEFRSLPKVGDRYYGSILQILNKESTPSLKYGWIKITSVMPKDSMISYTTSTRFGKLTFTTLAEEHENFTSDVFKGRFTYDSDRNKIKIISTDKKTRFEVTIMDGQTKNYKIPID